MSAVEHLSNSRSLAPDDLAIRVRAEGHCWTLECDPGFETLVFRSGGAAETAGRNLAARFARSGHGVRMAIEDRRHEVVGTKIFFPLACSDPPGANAPIDVRGWA